VIRKILLLSLLVALGVIAMEALSEGQGTAVPGLPSFSKPVNVPSTTSPSTSAPKASEPGATFPSTTFPTTSPPRTTPSKGDDKPRDLSPTSSVPSSSKTFPTSSGYSTSPSSASGPKTLFIDRAVVTLIHDNKVPATEPGMLTKVLVKEGESVEEEFQVAEIDSRSVIAKQTVAKEEHNAAVAQAENNAEVEVAEKAELVAHEEYDQSQKLYDNNTKAVSLSQLRKDKFAWQKAQAQIKQANSEKHIAGLTANAKKAQYDAASIELDLRQIKSPFKGQVVEIMKNVGDWVTVGEPIMHIVGLDRLRVRGNVYVDGDQGASHDEVIGKPVTITVESSRGRTHTVKGIIGFASPVIEGYGSDRQFRIWAEVDNEKMIDPVTKQESWKIQPGSAATMTIDLTPPRPAPPAKTEPAKGTKGKVDAFKPVTGEAEESGTKKSKER
jgi:multidrug efflux pump subunit AcrA (membrane-fusion protein)